MKKECRLCLGSNYRPHRYLSDARGRLQQVFADIRFAPEEVTTPVDFASSEPFVNQVAVLTTGLEAAAVYRLLKAIEENCGRQAEDKARGIVKIDIDLLQYGTQVRKPDDLCRDYIRRGLDFLTCRTPGAPCPTASEKNGNE